ncbi:Tigger transposable element-derived protein 1 [Harpegnathos saltator]|uniref:Tigger transposable element-derived protein 1 n=2 Tax=Harpegnathos saltator TaxID=610380 RepID=E2BME2_HARSA|nr:Tigger transposable element-derived protein 1 [Harpegnathos saltator]
MHDVQYMTLLRYIKKLKQFRETEEQKSDCEPKTGYIPCRQVFNPKQEQTLIDFLWDLNNIFFGFTYKDIKILAYDFATNQDIMIPKGWQIKGEAGRDWLVNFKERNPKLPFRVNEINDSHFMKYTKSIVDPFYDELERIYEQANFTAENIYNVDEIELSMLPKAKTSDEEINRYLMNRVTKEVPLVTICFAVNALGKTVPPMFIFPKENFSDEYLRNSPHGSIGCANPSASMTRFDFFTYIKHFCEYTGATTEKPVLLVLDNHESHMSFDAINFCNENGIFLLAFPPHCSGKLQPIEKSVIQPFQKRFGRILDKWLEANSGKNVTVSDIPGMVKEIFQMVLTRSNIRTGFETTGIWPINRDIFTDNDFSEKNIKKEIKKQTKLKKSSLHLRSLANISGVGSEFSSVSQLLPSLVTFQSNINNTNPDKQIGVIELQPGTLQESESVMVLELSVAVENSNNPAGSNSLPDSGSQPQETEQIDGKRKHVKKEETESPAESTAIEENQSRAKKSRTKKVKETTSRRR